MRKFNRIALIASILSLWPQTASADFWCDGTPTSIFTNSNGAVIVQMPWRLDWVAVCNVKTSWKGIDPSVCWTWFSYLNTAITEQKPITAYYSGTGTCATVATYENAPAPYYVRLNP
ncbi:hypothetical protein Q9Q95_04910 [Sphingomonas sp. DG1-23]|uniref:hypothetical protein n=1 Tax=Sphingomonas sp. DG1-23 TaxID=3068316 RepID=UPI00273E198C|nr:hypothetical protein [Sphingomonas sp. DG1-23]MDP5278256.1 hypothetical protein [Sphingomonas sp. DG1-23]